LQWVKELKIAIAEENESKIEKLIQKLPQFSSLEQMEEAAFLMQEAHTFLKSEKEKTAAILLKIKKQKAFLNSTSSQKPSFDQSL
jgi:uncharacterized membrane protein YvbJ